MEGSNDTAPGWDSGNWTVLYENAAIESWETLFGPDDNRFKTQAFYFENNQEYSHYRFTVVATQGPSTCCMQIAEVELLAQLSSNPCEKVAFITPPVDTPVLDGESATFFTEVNGPWSLQWYKNGDPIPGATQNTYTTDPITAANADDTYSVEIVGCVFSQPVQAVIFTPSDTISYGLNFRGGGANGAPTDLAETDIAGFWQQAYWNNFDGGGTGLSLTNSNGQVDLVTVTFSSGGTWGSGTGTDNADQRMLNGMLDDGGTITFDNVPDGAHAIIAYSVARPLEFPNIDLTANGTTIYGRQMNADEYNPAPGFYSMTSTDLNNRSVGNMTRFDGIVPASGQVIFEFANAGGGSSTINGLQLILDAPAVGDPPAITTQPSSQNILEGRRALLSVEVIGAELSYQWRKDGFTLFNGNGISGANSATLSITGFGAGDEGRYDVAVANPAGTVVSAAAALNLWTGEIGDRLVGHWKLDETSGNTAADSAGGNAADLRDFFNPGWVAGQINNALMFDGNDYAFVDNYPKAETALGVSLWVNLQFLATTDFPLPIIRNWGNAAGQFTLGYTGEEPSQLQAQVRIGPNNVTVAAPTPGVQAAAWHHVALSADGARLTLYLDGEQIASTDYFGGFSSSPIDFLSIGTVLDDAGAIPTTPSNLFGTLDDIGIWTRALSATEVQAIYDAGQQGKDLSTVVIDIPEEPEITSISIDADGNVVIEFIGTLVYSDTVNGDYAPVDGATSPHIATQPGFYQTMGQ